MENEISDLEEALEEKTAAVEVLEVEKKKLKKLNEEQRQALEATKRKNNDITKELEHREQRIAKLEMQLEDKSKELKQEAFLLKEQGSLLNGLQKDIISKQNGVINRMRKSKSWRRIKLKN